MRELTRAIVAASSTVTIDTTLPQEVHQDCVCSLRPLITTTRSVSMVISILFFVANLSVSKAIAVRRIYVELMGLRNFYDGKALSVFLSSAVVALTLAPIL